MDRRGGQRSTKRRVHPGGIAALEPTGRHIRRTAEIPGRRACMAGKDCLLSQTAGRRTAGSVHRSKGFRLGEDNRLLAVAPELEVMSNRSYRYRWGRLASCDRHPFNPHAHQPRRTGSGKVRTVLDQRGWITTCQPPVMEQDRICHERRASYPEIYVDRVWTA